MLILLEFNELTPQLLSRFIAAGDLPNFQRLRAQSVQFITTAGDDPLEPWIQWPTIHSGLSYGQHGARYIGQGRDIKQPFMGAAISHAGIPVGIFGMLNGNYRDLTGYLVPDPWADSNDVQPRSLVSFFKVISRCVQENTRSSPGIRLHEWIAFAAFMVTHGLTFTTVRSVAWQLLTETAKRGLRWRRVLILDLLQYDAFRHLNARYGVGFATFFSNSTAHLQHYYWRNMAPSGFAEPIEANADESLGNAIRSGYRAMDRLLGRIMHDYPNATLVLCTGLSQQPWFETTKCTYRPVDFKEFIAFVGLRPSLLVRPVMAERFRIVCNSINEAMHVETALKAVTCDNSSIVGVDRRDNDVFAGCDVYDAGTAVLQKRVNNGAGAARSFGDLFYRITSMNSGTHHSDGVLWVGLGQARVIEEKFPLTQVAPMILSFFKIPAPPTMSPPSYVFSNTSGRLQLLRAADGTADVRASCCLSREGKNHAV